MKKTLAVLLLIVSLFCFAGCGARNSGHIENVAVAVSSKYIDFEVVERDVYEGWTILYDKNTKVMYIILDGYQSTGMTPILNADGTPKLYKGE